MANQKPEAPYNKLSSYDSEAAAAKSHYTHNIRANDLMAERARLMIITGNVPSHVARNSLWKRLLDTSYYADQFPPDTYNVLSHQPENKWYHQITLDKNRTYPTEQLFKTGDGKEKLERILNAYSYFNPDLGYCQGMSFVVGMLLLNKVEEKDAFWTLVALMDKHINEYYTSNLAGLKDDTQLFKAMLKDEIPAVWRALKDIDLTTFTSKWFLTLFTNFKDTESVTAMWDLIFLEGKAGIMKIAMAILKCCKDRILEAKKPDETIGFLLHIPPSVVEKKNLFSMVDRTDTITEMHKFTSVSVGSRKN